MKLKRLFFSECYKFFKQRKEYVTIVLKLTKQLTKDKANRVVLLLKVNKYVLSISFKGWYKNKQWNKEMADTNVIYLLNIAKSSGKL